LPLDLIYSGIEGEVEGFFKGFGLMLDKKVVARYTDLYLGYLVLDLVGYVV
jgi:hypothetical protein